jgi:hypothetical protein
MAVAMLPAPMMLMVVMTWSLVVSGSVGLGRCRQAAGLDLRMVDV